MAAKRGKKQTKNTDLQQVKAGELRKKLGSYLERAASGERFVITSRGAPLALLAPLPIEGEQNERPGWSDLESALAQTAEERNPWLEALRKARTPDPKS